MKIFAGRSNRTLAEAICKSIDVPLGKVLLRDFPNGETFARIEENVRGEDTYIVQSTCPPVNQNMMELFIIIDALRRASANRITAVLPFYGYARQDRRVRSARVPITAKVVADMLGSAGINRVLTVDLHADQIQGFFGIPVDNIYGSPVLLSDIERKNYQDLIIVSPDVGGVVRARAMAKQLDDADLAIIDKRRPKANEAEVMNIVGDVQGRTCLLVDDIVDTAGTLCAAAEVLKKNGANKVVAYCTHPVLSGTAIDNIDKSTLDEVVVTDTIPLTKEAQESNKIRQLSVADELAESIRRISNEESLSALFTKRVQPTLF